MPSDVILCLHCCEEEATQAVCIVVNVSQTGVCDLFGIKAQINPFISVTAVYLK